MNILPQKYKNLPHFAIKIDQFCKLSVLIGKIFIVPIGPEYYIDQKVTQVHIRKKKKIKNINLIPKQEYQNLHRETPKFNYTKYS